MQSFFCWMCSFFSSAYFSCLLLWILQTIVLGIICFFLYFQLNFTLKECESESELILAEYLFSESREVIPSKDQQHQVDRSRWWLAEPSRRQRSRIFRSGRWDCHRVRHLQGRSRFLAVRDLDAVRWGQERGRAHRQKVILIWIVICS